MRPGFSQLLQEEMRTLVVYTVGQDERFWMVNNLPDEAVVVMGDVGMPGMVTGVRIIDKNGLVTREVAEWMSNRGDKHWTTQLYEGENPVACIRLTAYSGQDAPMLDGGFGERYLLVHQIHGNISSNWFCREDMETPSEDLIQERWQRLARKFPDQRFIQQHAGRAEVTGGGHN